MASPVAVGAGVVGGTAAVGATSFAVYQAFKKDSSTEEVKNPTLRDGQADNPGTSNTANTATLNTGDQAGQSTGKGDAQDTSGKGSAAGSAGQGSTGEAGTVVDSSQSTDQVSGSSTGGTTTPGTGTPAAAAAAA
ncbi:hypothetical protein [Candidatus Mycoplasma haematohominis]|uniref:hypothetical protein n=1 Tax=Candidatus Mycoplasma haematohominis TaxID=1494318 RepID=UPI001C0A6B99|nr:hypothetical protein [Candidatus Mycoplasma haemohominis]